ncbi:hypothetical protein IJ425_05810 [bacterium]|nr:hypothetical protein [bacterium]
MRINNVSYNYQAVKQQQNRTTPAFKANVPAPVVNGLSTFYGKVASQDWYTKFIKSFSKSNKTFTHILAAESCLLSGFYMLTTLTNKKIKKEQKPQMIINDALTLGVSTAGAYVLDDKVSKMVSKMSDNYFLKHQDFYINQAKAAAENVQKSGILDSIGETAANATEDNIKAITDKIAQQAGKIVAKGKDLKAFEITSDKLKAVQEGVSNAITANKGNSEAAKKAAMSFIDDVYDKLAGKIEADKIIPGINKIKTLVIFGIIYRYLSPVIMTPIANKISAKFFDKKDKTQKA